MATPTQRRIASLVMLPVLLLAVSAFGYDGLRCRFMGIVERCCCPGADQPRPHAALRQGDCCAQFTVEMHKAPTEAPRELHSQPAPASSIDLVAQAPEDAPPSPPAWARASRPPELPPLRLIKQSFLI